MAQGCTLLLFDGLGDRAYGELGGRTPLAAAATPALDSLAAAGCAGMYHAASPGVALSSENAHFHLFGYTRGFPGRGWLEALGSGAPVAPGDAVYLAHLTSVVPGDGTLVMKEKRPPARAGETRALFEAIREFESEGTRFRFHPTKGVDGVLVLRGRTSRYVSDVNTMTEGEPLMEPLPLAERADDPDARAVALALKAYLSHCWGVLASHPVNRDRAARGENPLNMLATQRGGSHQEVLPFPGLFGQPALIIGSGPLYRGLSRFLGMDFLEAPDSGDVEKDYFEALEMAARAAGRYGFIHVHSKAPDKAAHTKDPRAKSAAVEALDRAVARALAAGFLPEDRLVVATADHATPSGGPLIHSGECVPVVFKGPGLWRDRVEQFDEVSCAAGALGHLRGPDILHLILNHLDRARIWDVRDAPEKNLFWPGNRRPFRVGD